MAESIHQFKFKDLHGKETNLSDYQGKVLMVVNTASKCGFTPQYADLEKLYESYKEKGLEILAFPSNQFGGQEPLEGEEIENFCQVNYGVSFKVMEKSDVKGANANPVFKFLSDKDRNGKVGLSPKWNFQKYLIDKDGHVVDYYLSFTKPTAGKVKRKIEKLLKD